MYLKFLQKLWCLGSLGPKQAKCSAVKKTRWKFLEGQFRNEKLSFVHKNKTEYSFELSLSICVFSFAMGLRRARAGSAILSTLSLFFLFIVPRFVELLLRFLVLPQF